MIDHKAVLLLMFDLPAITNEDHREYYRFRKNLMSNGFLKLQESCYLKMIRNISSLDLTVKSLNGIMPKNGKVSVLPLSMTGFREMRCLLGEPFPMNIFTDDILIIGDPEDQDCA